MSGAVQFVVGTSGYSFADWVGTFYPPGTRRAEMFEYYAQRFGAVELNFTFYRMPTARTLAALAAKSPAGFEFWVKANRSITHDGDPSPAEQFIENLSPLAEAGKLAGVLLQFPQSFHRTVAGRRYLSDALERFAAVRCAVEFRHRSWQHPSTLAGLAERNVTIVVPDVPPIDELYHSEPVATTDVGYLRLHSRDPDKWYAGAAKRYDYDYSTDQMRRLIADWNKLAGRIGRVYAFFNNCYLGRAAANAEIFDRLVGRTR